VLSFMLAAVLISAIAAIEDFRNGSIPNWATLGGIVGGLVGHAIYGWASDDWGAGLARAGWSLGGLVFCSLAPLVMYRSGAMGGGDVKLFAAIGALCQPLLGIEAQMYAFVIAAVVAPARLAYEGKLLRLLRDSLSMFLRAFRPQARAETLPRNDQTWFRLGPAVFVGMLVTLVIHRFETLTP
jgi:prepilin peptidase CpaA